MPRVPVRAAAQLSFSNFPGNLLRIHMASNPLHLRPRVLVVDDNKAIHEDFLKILGGYTGGSSELLEAERLLLGEATGAAPRPTFQIDTALQGQEGVARVEQALKEEQPYAMAFIDMRMPPGWDGLETIQRLWELDPHVQVVICSAHSDYDWTEVIARLDHSDKLLVIKKPFEPIEVLQCANALTRKWENERTLRRQVEHLEHVVETRTQGRETANKTVAALRKPRRPDRSAESSTAGRSSGTGGGSCRAR